MPQREHQNIQGDSSPDRSSIITSFDELGKGLAIGAVSRRKALRWMGGAVGVHVEATDAFEGSLNDLMKLTK
jgi:hypothetical protein